MGGVVNTRRQLIIIPKLCRKIHQSPLRVRKSTSILSLHKPIRGGCLILETVQPWSGTRKTLRNYLWVEQLVHWSVEGEKPREKGSCSNIDANLQGWGELGTVLQTKIVYLSRLLQIKHCLRSGWSWIRKCYVPPMRKRAARKGYWVGYSVRLEESRFRTRRYRYWRIYIESNLIILGTWC